MYNHKRSWKCLKVLHHTTGPRRRLAVTTGSHYTSVSLFSGLNNNFAGRDVVGGYYLMMPVDKEAISTSVLQPEPWHWTSKHREAHTPSRSHSKGHFMFDNFWLLQNVHPLSGGQLPWQPDAVYRLFFDGHRGMTDFTGTSQGEGEKCRGIKRGKWGTGTSEEPQPLVATKKSMFDHYSTVCPLPSLGRLFSPRGAPARMWAALTTQELCDWEWIMTGRLRNQIWLTDNQMGSKPNWGTWS